MKIMFLLAILASLSGCSTVQLRYDTWGYTETDFRVLAPVVHGSARAQLRSIPGCTANTVERETVATTTTRRDGGQKYRVEFGHSCR
jgi:hypothetical protein